MDTKDEKLTTEEYIRAFIRSMAAIETAMEPFKDQKRDLRENYRENGWLSKEEMRLAIKAYRLLKSDTDMEQLTDFFNNLKKKGGLANV